MTTAAREFRIGATILSEFVLLVTFGYAANFTIDSIDTELVGPQAEQVAGVLPDLFVVSETDPAASAQG